MIIDITPSAGLDKKVMFSTVFLLKMKSVLNDALLTSPNNILNQYLEKR